MAVQAQLYSGNSFGIPQDFQMETPPTHIPADFSTAISLHIQTQGWELEQFINSQNESLRRAIQDHIDFQTSSFLRSCESEAVFLVAQKDQEIAVAANKTAELREYLRRLEVEGLAWRTRAWENETMAESLSGAIQQMQREYHGDKESYCSARGEGVAWCRRCEEREARVVLLPCQHLCSCGECEAFLLACPVCMTGKTGSIAVEAYA